MANENERAYPAGYYFDDKKDDVTEVPTEVAVETPTEIKTETVTEVPAEAKVETVKAPELSPSEVAKQRRESVVNFFKDTKTNFKNTMQSLGGGIRRFFSKAGSLGSEAINQAGVLGKETLEGAKTLGNEALDVIVAPDAYIKKGTENLLEWAKNKRETISNFAKSKGELLQAIARLVESRITENVNEVQTKFNERYEDLKQYGHDAMESAAVSIRDVKEGLRNKKNNLIIAFLKSVEERHRDRANKVANTIQLLQGLKSN